MIAAVLAVACSSSGARTGGAEPAAGSAEPSAAIAGKPDAVRYTGDRQGTPLTLAVVPGEGAISFELSAAPPDAACRFRLAGEATEKQGDLESRYDGEGNAHFVAEYLHESEDCGASISIDLDTRSMAWVSVYDCPRIPEQCRPDSWGPLRAP